MKISVDSFARQIWLWVDYRSHNNFVQSNSTYTSEVCNNNNFLCNLYFINLHKIFTRLHIKDQ